MASRPGSSASRMIVSEVWNGTEASPGMSGIDRPAAGRDHELVGGDLLGADRQPPRADEVAPPAEDGDVVALLPVLAGRSADVVVDPAEDPVPDVRPADPDQLEVDPQRAGLLAAYGPGRPGRRTSCSGCSPTLRQVPPNRPGLDDRDRLLGEPVVEDRVARSRCRSRRGRSGARPHGASACRLRTRARTIRSG